MKVKKGTIEWAIGKMNNGCKVRRKIWIKNAYYYINNKSTNVKFMCNKNIDNMSNCTIFDKKEWLAIDWELYKEHGKKYNNF